MAHLQELSDLLDGASPEARESIRHELVGLADRAGALGFEGTCDAARAAAVEVELGAGPPVLASVARSLRGGRFVPMFPPIAVVTDGHGDLVLPRRPSLVEPVHVVETVGELFDQVWFEDLQAVIVPVKPRRELQRLARRLPGRVYAWGPGGDVKKRLLAVRDGASAYLAVPLDPEAMLARVRSDTWRRLVPKARALLVSGADRQAARIEQALWESGVVVERVETLAELLPRITRFCPDVVLLRPAIDDGTPAQVLDLIRGHETAERLPVLLSGPEMDLDVDRVLPSEPAPAARAVRAWLDRPRGRASGRDPLTGLPDRAAVLSRLEEECARHLRTGDPLTVGVVDVDALRGINDVGGRALGDRALRTLAEVLGASLRSYDVVGRLGSDAFLVALPGCRAPVARRRLRGIQQALARRCAADPHLEHLTFSAGLADSDLGLHSLLQRADAALGALVLDRRVGGVEVDR